MSECQWDDHDERSLPLGNVPQKRLHLVERYAGHDHLHLPSPDTSLNAPMILKGSTQIRQTSVSDRTAD